MGTRRPNTAGSRSGNESSIREVSRTLTAARRDKLIALRRREQMKDVLIQKFRRNIQDCSESVIGKEVAKFVDKAKVTEANLGRLERRIRHRASAPNLRKDGNDTDEREYDEIDDDVATTVPDDVVSCYSEAPSLALSKCSHTTSLSALLNAGKSPTDFPWGRLDEYAMFLSEQDHIRSKEAGKAKQRELRKYLDKQVKDDEKKKEKVIDDEKRYYDNLVIELAEWEASEKIKAEELRQKLLQEKQGRDSQLAADNKRKDAETAKMKAEEKEMMERTAQEVEAEKRALEKKKLQEKKAIQKVFVENMREKQLKEQDLEDQRCKDLEEQMKNQKLQEELAKKRDEENAERDSRQKALIEKMKSDVLTAAAEQGKEDAIRAKAQRDEADNRAALIENLRAQKLQDMKDQTQQFLFQQMAEKDIKKVDAMRLKDLQATVLLADQEDYKAVEEEKVLSRRLRNLENRAQLEKQIHEKHQIKTKAMSASEISMNIDLINVVEKTLKERDIIKKHQVEEDKRRKAIQEAEELDV